MKKALTIILLLLFLGFIVAIENTFSYTFSKRVYELRKERDSLERVVSELKGDVARLRTASRVESLARASGMKFIWETRNVAIETLKIRVRPLDNPDSLLAVLLSGRKKVSAKDTLHLKDQSSGQKR